MLELLDTQPACDVLESEYHRLLGYPRGHVPGDRACELAAWARTWFAKHGRPWVYVRETSVALTPDSLRLGGHEFRSRKLHDHFTQAHATRAVLVAVSAGRAGEEHARQLWEEQQPDEYFFLEIFGSAVVEHLVASLSGRICDLAEREGFIAVPHYSPGYAGWDIAEQRKLFELIMRDHAPVRPEPLEVLDSGMLRPNKSLLAVVGLTARTAETLRAPHLVPCESCSYSPCNYRRAPYRHAPGAVAGVAPTAAAIAVSHPRGAPLTQHASYSVNPRALEKWTQERVQLLARPDGTTTARFRFDGTTCANLGRPLAFEYRLVLGPAADGFPIRQAECGPAEGDTGHQLMCAYLTDGSALMDAIAAERPLLGRPLNDVLAWERVARPSGCFCDAESRLHKWGLALEAIHFALVRGQAASPSAYLSSVSSSVTLSS